MEQSNPDVEAYIEKAAPEVRPLLTALRETVRETLPRAREELRWGKPVYSELSPICVLEAGADHVTLGFFKGADLPDPGELLLGLGSRLRYLKVEVGEEIPREDVAVLLRHAAMLDRL